MSERDYTQLDAIIHSRIRLAVMATLASVDHAEFTLLREQTGATDGNLSTHLRKLEEAGYVAVEKAFEERRPVSRYHLTPEGRGAFAGYIERLETLIGIADPRYK
ncbi:MAG: winged helix-turn-helix domain-containing protein [Rhodanobacteraceae bacterium]